MSTIITVSSIRGGVGKSSLSIELALYLSLKGKVLLIDTDFYAPTLLHEIKARKAKDIIKPSAYFRDVLRGFCSVDEVVVDILPAFHLIFSDPNVNLWELSTDVGTKTFWIEDDPDKPSQTELGLAKLKEYVKAHNYEYVLFDSMAGLAYPVVFFSYLSDKPLFLARPSLPQIKDIIGFVNLIGTVERPVNVIWSNVPNIDEYMQSTRDKLNKEIEKNCGKKFNSLSIIPRDPKFEENALKGTLSLIPGKLNSIYFEYIQQIAEKVDE